MVTPPTPPRLDESTKHVTLLSMQLPRQVLSGHAYCVIMGQLLMFDSNYYQLSWLCAVAYTKIEQHLSSGDERSLPEEKR